MQMGCLVNLFDWWDFAVIASRLDFIYHYHDFLRDFGDNASTPSISELRGNEAELNCHEDYGDKPKNVYRQTYESEHEGQGKQRKLLYLSG